MAKKHTSGFWNLYKTPNGTFEKMKDMLKHNPGITTKMFYTRCKKYPNEWEIIHRTKSNCKACGEEFDTKIKHGGYCCSKCRGLHNNYGTNSKYYYDKLKEQNNSCAICKKEFDDSTTYRQINMDHNHKTNKVRGILCSPCNRALGLLKENKTIIINMIKYIEHYEN